MKRLFFIFFSLIFAFGILGASVVRTIAQTSPKFKITPLTNISPTPTVTPTPPKVDYYLAYPGILPDHLLYPLKMVRDRIWLFLTMDPVKKAELLLLYADKRLGAARALIEGGKPELGVSTLTKAEKYLEQAVGQARDAKKAGKDAVSLYEKLTKATLKHQEVLEEVSLRLPDEAKGVLEGIKRYSREGYEAVTREK